ncbi:MAG: hypothetical protein LBS20_09185 [Prevotella sp.]|nr:hypothetical protein [Prevotella sp.]
MNVSADRTMPERKYNLGVYSQFTAWQVLSTGKLIYWRTAEFICHSPASLL